MELKMCKFISIEDLLLLSNVNIIDVRYRYEFDSGHINNAINIPFYDLERNYMYYLNFSDKYYLYCELGENSEKLCKFLSSLGYNVCSVIGGYSSYRKFIS